LRSEARADADSVRTGESADYRYWAFISYSHADKAWGDWLHRALETYRVPKHLVGKDGAFGPVPRRLYPIFRDREELSASSSLGTNIQRALQQSRSMIVICSPNSASSLWVNEEIKYFKSLGREDRILALIVKGEPGASDGRKGASLDQECFPEALRFRLGADGQVGREPTEPIAGDARKGKDGKLNAKLKLIAGLVALDYAALKQREQERRRRYLVGLSALASTIAVAMTGLAIFAFGAEREAQMQAKAANTARDQADGLINFMLVDLRDKLQPIGKLSILGDVVDKAKAYLDGLPTEQMNTDRLLQRGTMLSNLGDVLRARGELPEAVNTYRQELLVDQRIVQQQPASVAALSALANCYDRLGDALRDNGDLQEVQDAYERALAVKKTLVEQNASDRPWRYNLSVGYLKVGDLLESRGNLPEALLDYRKALEIQQTLAREESSNTRWQRAMSVSYNRIGDLVSSQGKLNEALDAFQNGLAIIKRLLDQDKSNAGWQNDLAISYERNGDVFKARGEQQEALRYYQLSLGIRQELADQDRSNTVWQRNLCICYQNVGDALEASGKRQEALDAYQKSMTICQQLVSIDHSNTVWQSDLSVSNAKIGDALVAKNDLSGALEAYRRALAITKAIAEKDKSNSSWQQDLALRYQNVGDVVALQSDLREALSDYRLSLNIRQALANQDSSNADWQQDLATTHEKIGDILKLQGELDPAITEYEVGLNSWRALVQKDKANSTWQRKLISSLCHAADARIQRKAEKDLAEAQALLHDASVVAADYHGSDQSALMDSIRQSLQKLGQ
jgi:eukaryotic-like serine/threonine-protein kinase